MGKVKKLEDFREQVNLKIAWVAGGVALGGTVVFKLIASLHHQSFRKETDMLETLQHFQTYITAALILLSSSFSPRCNASGMRFFRLADGGARGEVHRRRIHGDTGKTSFSRLAGVYVIIRTTTVTGPIPAEWMTLFMFPHWVSARERPAEG